MVSSVGDSPRIRPHQQQIPRKPQEKEVLDDLLDALRDQYEKDWTKFTIADSYNHLDAGRFIINLGKRPGGEVFKPLLINKILGEGPYEGARDPLLIHILMAILDVTEDDLMENPQDILMDDDEVIKRVMALDKVQSIMNTDGGA